VPSTCDTACCRSRSTSARSAATWAGVRRSSGGSIMPTTRPTASRGVLPPLIAFWSAPRSSRSFTNTGRRIAAASCSAVVPLRPTARTSAPRSSSSRATSSWPTAAVYLQITSVSAAVVAGEPVHVRILQSCHAANAMPHVASPAFEDACACTGRRHLSKNLSGEWIQPSPRCTASLAARSSRRRRRSSSCRGASMPTVTGAAPAPASSAPRTQRRKASPGGRLSGQVVGRSSRAPAQPASCVVRAPARIPARTKAHSVSTRSPRRRSATCTPAGRPVTITHDGREDKQEGAVATSAIAGQAAAWRGARTQTQRTTRHAAGDQQRQRCGS
jgi:hypothetical protein